MGTRGFRAALACCCIAGFTIVSSPAHAAPGDLDRTFSGDGVAYLSPPGGGDSMYIREVALDSSGRVVIASGTNNGSATSVWEVARFLPSGAPDASFGGGDGRAGVTVVGFPKAMVLDGQGRIYVGGDIDTNGGGTGDARYAVVRFTPNGEVDAAWGGLDGDPAGFATTTINYSSDVYDLELDSQGRLVAAGRLSLADDTDYRMAVVRYTTTGDEDDSFDLNGVQGSDFPAYGQHVGIDGAGRIVVAGSDGGEVYVSRFTPAGADDLSFGPGGGRSFAVPGAGAFGVGGLLVAADGSVVTLSTPQFDPHPDELFGLDAAGNPFAIGGQARRTVNLGPGDNYVSDLERDASGRFLIAGQSDRPATKQSTVVRLRADGANDPAFGGGDGVGGEVSISSGLPTSSFFVSTAVDPVSGRIYAAGGNTPNGMLARIEATPRCGGKVPTIAGTPGKDKLKGTKGKDVIAGGPGKDKISGLGGKDFLCGEDGKDTLLGGGGNDKLIGGKGKDKLIGGRGKDKLKGGKGKDKQKQ
jgi:uncharacterized delta-60 repeat protein